jgi:hypothetical protein
VTSRRSRRVRAVVGAGVVAALATVGLATASGAAVPAQDDGVTANAIKLGFIYPGTGLAAPISGSGVTGFKARIDAQNAAGGVNGRKIEVVDRDDASSGANLTQARDLVENEHVFAIVNESPFAFLTYRYLLDAGGKRVRPALTLLTAQLGEGNHVDVISGAQAIAMSVDAAIGRYTASAPEFLMPSTSGPTSEVPKSTDVLVYVDFNPTSGTA